MARAKLDNCPVCRQPLPEFGGWPAWCPACGWGLEPEESATPAPTGIRGWWQHRTDRDEAAELQRLLADPTLLARRHPRSTAIYAAAVGVHLATVLLLAVGAWVMTTGIVTVLKVFAGVVAFGLVVVTFPLHRLRPTGTVGAAVAPATLKVAATVANALGVPPPTRLRVTSYGTPAPPASRRTVTIDADRWEALGYGGRLALLAHELSHHNGHDPRRALPVTIASETLDGWLFLLRPDPRTAGRRARRAARGGWVGVAPGTAAGLSELLLPVVIAPLYASVLAAGWVLREGGTLAGLRAELYADAVAARAGGDVTELIDGELAEAAAGGNAINPLVGLPAIERERRRRVAVAAGTRVDAMHPTYAARLEMLAAAAGPAQQAPVFVDAADLDAMSRELVALRRPNE